MIDRTGITTRRSNPRSEEATCVGGLFAVRLEGGVVDDCVARRRPCGWLVVVVVVVVGRSV